MTICALSTEYEELTAGTPCPLCGIPLSETTDRVTVLEFLLGEGLCRQLGIIRVPENFLLSVVIPVYNERETLQALIDRVRSVPIPKEIVLVDDCSADGSRELLMGMEGQEDLRICYHEVNQGKG
ncbi:MAG: glycosyltransferase, partial [Planctomycetes bacterium]|nr:glycosyltransferase [Planctomycetota bacterium]